MKSRSRSTWNWSGKRSWRRRRVGTGGVIWKIGRRELCPCLLDGSDDSPFRFHFVAAGEERRIAQHGIQQQGFIGHRRVRAEDRSIGEVCLHGRGAHLAAWPLSAKGDGDPFIRLNPQRDHVALDLIRWRGGKQRLRRAL